MTDIAGRVALVTGAAGGLGAALANALVDGGAHVMLADIEADRIELPRSGRVASVALDVTDPAQWAAALDRTEAELGPIAILVNNAGLGLISPVVDERLDRWRRTFEVNAFGPFLGTRAALPRMQTRGGGHVVIVASEAGVHGSPGMAAYSASKHAALGLARSLRRELADTPIGVSVVCPGMVRTGLVVNSMNRLATDTAAGTPSATAREMAAQALDQGMDPAKVAAHIVQAVISERFYVFTHPTVSESLAHEHEEMMAAAAMSADPDYQPPDLAAFRARSVAVDHML